MIFWTRTALVRKLRALKWSLKKENRCTHGTDKDDATKKIGSWELQFEEYGIPVILQSHPTRLLYDFIGPWKTIHSYKIILFIA
jgi:hypothetical protein